MPGVESTVRPSTPMPPGYVFVPKGNPYITANCRRRTLKGLRTVYVVKGSKANTLGIRVPANIASEVRADEAETRTDRARAVSRHDAHLSQRFREVVEREFPQVPAAEVPAVVRRAMQKGSSRVGRTGTLELEEKAQLAVRAYIRHKHTDYEQQLRRGVPRLQARRSISAKVDEVVKAWGGQAEKQHKRKRRHGKSKNKAKEPGKANGAPADKSKKPDKAKGVPATQGTKSDKGEGAPTTSKRKRSRQKKRKRDGAAAVSPRRARKLQVRQTRQQTAGPAMPAGDIPKGGGTEEEDDDDESEDDYSDYSDGSDAYVYESDDDSDW